MVSASDKNDRVSVLNTRLSR